LNKDISNEAVERVRVVVIDDEPGIRAFLHSSFPKGEYELFEAVNGQQGLELIRSVNPQLVLLDLGLPDIDGVEVARRLRKWSQVPVIVLSAREEEADKVHAFDAGIDDYLTKPFGVAELLARVRVSLRHATSDAKGTDDDTFEFKGLRINFTSREVWRDGEQIHLTPIEYDLFSLLVRDAGKVVTHNRLLTTVWGTEYANNIQYLRVYMGQLRHKLELNPAKPKYFMTEPGIGYRLRIYS
jgi:two-component system KDP operon response regulator KdpE